MFYRDKHVQSLGGDPSAQARQISLRKLDGNYANDLHKLGLSLSNLLTSANCDLTMNDDPFNKTSIK